MIASRLLFGVAMSGILATAAQAQTAPAPTMTDGQIVKYVQTVDMGEVKDAKMALKRSKNADVKSFANQMVKDHTDNEKKMAALAKKAKLKPAASETTKLLMEEAKAGDKTLMKDKGDAFDKDYIQAQAKMHGEVANTIQNQLIPAAKNDDLKAALSETLSTVQEHQKMAQDLAGKMP